MINTLTTIEAVTELLKDENASWSYEGATILVEFMEQLEEDNGSPIELDVVALRCEWTEATTAELEESYGMKMLEIHENTIVLGIDGKSFIVQQF